jgi:serine/threonine protein kinase
MDPPARARVFTWCERSHQTQAAGPPGARRRSVMAALSSRDETGASVCARFMLLEELGKGSCGVVYKARDVETQELVAVKVLSLTQSV